MRIRFAAAMRTFLAVAMPAALSMAVLSVVAEEQADAADSGCLACHRGIEPIRDPKSGMMEEIFDLGRSRGDPAGCIICHGGDAAAKEKDAAHQGKAFYPDPGSPWINEATCGLCHPDQVEAQWRSLMMTEAGKIQGTAWAFGSLTGYEHRWGNYDVENPKDKKSRLGTDAYRRYMERLKTLEPQVFVDKHKRLPDALAEPGLDKLAGHPELAAFTYLRNQCLRCHHAVKGRAERGDYRGMGCSSCHLPYGNEGLYEGDDPSISKKEPGHALVHSIQATREAKVTIHGRQYSGIPVETCTTCHDRGKRIGVSFQGLMEIPYTSPFTEEGAGQPALHTKHYLAMQQDVHYRKGMTCQDCHTSIDVHGDGFLAAANLGAVEIECSDCHGTTRAYPWELPLGFMDEFGDPPADGPARGTARRLSPGLKQGTVYPPRDGYLLTARGNPYSNVVRDGRTVVVHTAAGQDIKLTPLKKIQLDRALSLEGRVAMDAVDDHLRKMECYTCHAGWSPQCYGCHVKIDYSGGKTSYDWLAAGHEHARPEHAADRGETQYDLTIPGQVEEQRSFTRWEDPPLGVNGEGRITPLAPGCQVSVTVIGPDGKPIIANHIFRTLPGSEGSGPEGQLGIDMSPLQPHTMTEKARTCPSCHLSDKALGYGIGSGRMTRPPNKPVVVDLETVDGHILSKNARTQMAAVDGLAGDWSRLVDEDGRQLQTVGHHFKRSGPLSDRQRAHVSRQGVCLACHQEIPKKSLAVSLLHHVAEYADLIPKTPEEHASNIHKILLVAAWFQVAAPVLVFGAVALLVLVVVVRKVRRRKAKKES